MLRLAVRFERTIRYLPLPERAGDLGAAPDSDLYLPFPGVSRRHARVEPQPQGLLLRDLGSKNGLLLAGERYYEVVLHAGDSVQVGRAWLALEDVSSSEAELGLTIESASVPGASETTWQDADTPSLVEDADTSSPAAALAWVRAAAGRGGDLAAEENHDLLEQARAALGAVSLFLFHPTDTGPALAHYCGRLPGADELAAAGEAVAALERGEPMVHRFNGSSVLLAAHPRSEPARPAVAAILALRRGRVASWQEDFFDHLAEKLAAASVRHRSRRPEEAALRNTLEVPADFVLGGSAALQGLLEHLRATVRSQLDVVILGETGTGKELFARIVHASGLTPDGPFVAINCAAIPAELLEAELFGVEARVATGVDPRPGRFAKAEGGSIFLDEVGDMPEVLQAKVLRTLQEREILPLGAHQPKKIHLRVISASNKDLPHLVQTGRFRADLYYRLRGLQFHLPPLRERREDIPPLVLHFAQRAARSYDKEVHGVSRKAVDLLTAYSWPGNVRELKNEVERAVLLCSDGGTLESEHFGPVRWAMEQMALRQGGSTHPQRAFEETAHLASMVAARMPGAESRGEVKPVGSMSPPRSLQQQMNDVERAAIVSALAAARGNKSLAARSLGITRNGLALKIRRLGIEQA